jgi:hypothetical protein
MSKRLNYKRAYLNKERAHEQAVEWVCQIAHRIFVVTEREIAGLNLNLAVTYLAQESE